jgi:hypothetical protein
MADGAQDAQSWGLELVDPPLLDPVQMIGRMLALELLP